MLHRKVLRCLSRLSRLIREDAGRLMGRFKWFRRCRRWNRLPGVWVSRDAEFIADTAQLQLDSDGKRRGGMIHISAGDCLSDGVIIAPYEGSVYLEENVYLGPYCVVYGHGGLRIGRNTMIASHTVLIPANHSFDDPSLEIRDQSVTKKGVTIGEDVWIGCGVRILDGVTIGKGCVVGAGAVVNKSLPDYAIAVGVPAKVVGQRRTETPEAAALLRSLQTVFEA